MSKPICEAEARWKYWREDFYRQPHRRLKGFTKWAKRQMTRARRRYYKKLIADWLNELF